MFPVGILYPLLFRYHLMSKPATLHTWQFKNWAPTFFLGSVFVSFFWSLAPAMGWSYYSIEGMGIFCSIEWKERSFNVTSYNVAIFTFVFLLPFITLVYTNIKMVIKVRMSTYYLCDLA
jgi:hypothetical protein